MLRASRWWQELRCSRHVQAAAPGLVQLPPGAMWNATCQSSSGTPSAPQALVEIAVDKICAGYKEPDVAHPPQVRWRLLLESLV